MAARRPDSWRSGLEPPGVRGTTERRRCAPCCRCTPDRATERRRARPRTPQQRRGVRPHADHPAPGRWRCPRRPCGTPEVVTPAGCLTAGAGEASEVVPTPDHSRRSPAAGVTGRGSQRRGSSARLFDVHQAVDLTCLTGGFHERDRHALAHREGSHHVNPCRNRRTARPPAWARPTQNIGCIAVTDPTQEACGGREPDDSHATTPAAATPKATAPVIATAVRFTTRACTRRRGRSGIRAHRSSDCSHLRSPPPGSAHHVAPPAESAAAGPIADLRQRLAPWAANRGQNEVRQHAAGSPAR